MQWIRCFQKHWRDLNEPVDADADMYSDESVGVEIVDDSDMEESRSETEKEDESEVGESGQVDAGSPCSPAVDLDGDFNLQEVDSDDESRMREAFAPSAYISMESLLPDLAYYHIMFKARFFVSKKIQLTEPLSVSCNHNYLVVKEITFISFSGKLTKTFGFVLNAIPPWSMPLLEVAFSPSQRTTLAVLLNSASVTY
ncbi:unnamed protein product [Mucor hiemalis]